MKLFSRLFKRSSLPAVTSDFWYQIIDTIGRSTAGQRVTPATAERVAAVHACKTAICESFAMLPANVFEENEDGGKTKRKDHPLHALLRNGPNSLMDSFTFFETMQDAALDSGNAYAYITRKKSGAIMKLTPLLSQNMSIKLIDNGDEQSLGYIYKDPSGGTRELSQSEVFHLRHHAKDGIKGQTVISTAAEVIGYALALQEHGNKLFENGAFMSGIIEMPVPFETDTARERFIESFQKYMGVSKSGKLAVLEQGAKYSPHQMTNKDAETSEMLRLSISDIARIFRVPPIMIQVAEAGMSYASIEQLAIIWIQYTIQPWATRWERAIKKQLFTERGEEDLFVRFNLSALIRGDLKSRTESVVQQLQYGLKTINEGRALLDDNPISSDVGDTVFLSHNLIPSDRVLAGETKLMDIKKEQPVEENPNPEEPKKNDFQPLFNSLMSRIIRKEQKQIQTARKKPAFMKWAEGFYASHRDFMLETLEPAFLAAGIQEKVPDFVNTYISARQSDLLADQTGALSEDDSMTWCSMIDEFVKGVV